MPKHRGRDSAADMGAVRNLLDHPLDRPDANVHPVMQAQMSLQNRLDPRREGDDPALGQFSIGAALAVDHQPAVLPVQVLRSEVEQVRQPEARYLKASKR